ncbi:DUF6094 domain-containing protein [Brevibacillus sp. NPDC003359]|uniref:DUF6094 domain-containing protein n=1 Tax=unclassified Brevibacillus TaxID=2684853 RepID=UPI003685A77B
MARLASQAKGGFYATPTEMIELVSRRLVVHPGKHVNILDTCCGEGDALLQLKTNLLGKGATVSTYGNELEHGRYEKARTKLDVVIQGGYEGVRSSPYQTLCWLNPPYDNGGIERMELTAFRIHTYRNEQQMLQKGAVVCFCIPQEILADVASAVSRKLDAVRVYRFTDEFYPVFRQVVVFGYFQEPLGKDAAETEQHLKEVAKQGPSFVTPLDYNDGIEYIVPAAQGEVSYFRGEALRTDELWKDLQGSTVFGDVVTMMFPPSLQNANRLKRPPLPLKIAHMGLAITANTVDGNMGDFWLSGYTVNDPETQYIENDEGITVREEIVHRPVPVARIFSPKFGIVELK